ncbi:hypothetical protein Tco_1392868 [Tanacetum coccineum]
MLSSTNIKRYPCLDADFLVADSKFMKVAFGDGFKMLLFNPLVISTKDLSRNLKYVVPTGRVKVPAGSVVPTGKDNGIVSTGRLEDLSRTGPTQLAHLFVGDTR